MEILFKLPYMDINTTNPNCNHTLKHCPLNHIFEHHKKTETNTTKHLNTFAENLKLAATFPNQPTVAFRRASNISNRIVSQTTKITLQ